MALPPFIRVEPVIASGPRTGLTTMQLGFRTTWLTTSANVLSQFSILVLRACSAGLKPSSTHVEPALLERCQIWLATYGADRPHVTPT